VFLSADINRNFCFAVKNLNGSWINGGKRNSGCCQGVVVDAVHTFFRNREFVITLVVIDPLVSEGLRLQSTHDHEQQYKNRKSHGIKYRDEARIHESTTPEKYYQYP